MRVYVDCTNATSLRPGSVSDLMKKYGVTGFPAVLFLHPDSTVLKALAGKRDADEYLREMASIAEPWRPERRLPEAMQGLGELRGWFEKRVERLGDDDIQVRESATNELESLRDALDAALRFGLDTKDPERRERIRAVLREPERIPDPDPVQR